MFAVIYQWSLRPGSEAVFRAAFVKRSAEIRKRFGDVGSRLHRAEDGTWIGYSQWPSRESWEQANRAEPDASEAQKTLVESLISHETLFCMEVVEDNLR